MQCTEACSLFTDFADNTLAREELHILTHHLLDCQACALEWRQFQQTLSLIHSLDTHTPPADLLPGIHAKLTRGGIFSRTWALVETLNFSLSIPAAVAIFTIAMLGGFLLKTTHQEQSAIFPAQTARNNASEQGMMRAARRLPLVPNAMFAVAHNGIRQGGGTAPLDQTALAPHLAPGNDAHRLLSPDIHVLIEDIDHDSQVVLYREMLHHNWQLHRINPRLLLVHLPQADLRFFHEILGRHRFALVPATAAEARFGNDKKILTAAIRFQ